KPKHLVLCIIEYLPQELWSHEDSAVLCYCDRLLVDSHSSYAFDDKIEFLHGRMTMKCVSALRWQPPKSCSQNLALRSLQKIRIRNFHQIGNLPMKVFRLNDKVTIKWAHG